jgi:hypothetical protein
MKPGEQAVLFVRPERVHLAGADGAGGSDNTLESQVLDGVFEGPVANILLANRGADRPITVTLTNDGATPRVSRGETRRVAFSPDDAILLPPAGAAHGAGGHA